MQHSYAERHEKIGKNAKIKRPRVILKRNSALSAFNMDITTYEAPAATVKKLTI